MFQDIANSTFKPLLGLLFPLHEMLHDAGVRYFWLHIASGLLLAWIVCHLAGKDERGWRALFSRETWCSTSARNDYLLLLLRPVLGLSLLSWAAINGGAVTAWVTGLLRSIGVSGAVTDGPALLAAALLTICVFVVDDFLKWAVHHMFHRVPVLWEFHKVHHSAEVLNFATAERFHPVEAYFTTLVVVAGVGTVNALFITAFGHQLTPLTIAGANVLVFAANISGGVLRHSPCWVAFPPAIERWIISPAMHQIHHSNTELHWDKNMGATLSVWDRMVGTHLSAENQHVVSYGIGEETPQWRSFRTILFRPFVKLMDTLRAWAGSTDPRRRAESLLPAGHPEHAPVSTVRQQP